MTTYSISLDDVDLALLPLRTRKYNDFLKKDHYQFQLMATEEQEESVSTIFYKCHICAIDVPAAYAREHAASVKHRANARIADVAAERTRALISALPPPVVAQTARFCANCAITVGRNHEKTKAHRVAVMHDKLLWELMHAYVGDDCDSEEEDISDTDVFVAKEADPRHYNGFATWSQVKNKEVKQKKGAEVDLLSIQTNKKVIDRKEHNEAEQHNNYSKPVDSTTISSEITNNETPRNVTIKRSEVKSLSKEEVRLTSVETDKYQSGKRSELTNIVNELNKSAGTDNTITHKTAKADATPAVNTDKYPSSKSSELTNIVNGLNKSASTDNAIAHKTAKTDATPAVNTSSGIDKKTAQMATNNDQETAIATPSTPKLIHIVEYVEFVNKVNKTVKVNSDFYHSFTRKEDTIRCKVCSSSFNKEEVDSHMFSLKHLNKMPSYMIDEHYVRRIDEVFSHCIVCNQMVKHTNLAKHYLTIGHSQREKQVISDNPNSIATTSKTANIPNAGVKSNKPAIFYVIVKTADTNQLKTSGVQVKTPELKANTQNEVKAIDWPVIYPYEVTKQGAVRCVICDCNVPNNPDNRKEHLVGLVHVKNVKKRRETQTPTKLEYPYEATEQPSIARCVICDMKVNISSDNLKGHLDGRNHATNEMNEKKAQNSQNPCKLEYPYEATDQATIARCVVCDVKVTVSTDNLKGHLDGLNHATNEMNKKTRVRKTFAATKKATVARCNICHVEVPNNMRNLIDHLFGSVHT